MMRMSTEYSSYVSSVHSVASVHSGASVVSSGASVVSSGSVSVSRTNTKNYRIRKNSPNLLPLPSRSINKLYYTTTTDVLTDDSTDVSTDLTTQGKSSINKNQTLENTLGGLSNLLGDPNTPVNNDTQLKIEQIIFDYFSNYLSNRADTKVLNIDTELLSGKWKKFIIDNFDKFDEHLKVAIHTDDSFDKLKTELWGKIDEALKLRELEEEKNKNKKVKNKRHELVDPLAQEKMLFILRSVSLQTIRGLSFSNYMRFLSYQKSKIDKNYIYTDFCVSLGRDITGSYYAEGYDNYIKDKKRIQGNDYHISFTNYLLILNDV